MTAGELEQLKREFIDEIERLSKEFEFLSEHLLPFYQRRKRLRQELARTYPHNTVGEDEIDDASDSEMMKMRVVVIGYSWPVGTERIELRAELDRLSAENRPAMNKRAEALRLRKVFQKRLVQLAKQKVTVPDERPPDLPLFATK